MSARYTETAVQISCQVCWFKLKERDWKIRSTKVDTGDFKHELLNQLRSTMAVNVLINFLLIPFISCCVILFFLRMLTDQTEFTVHS